jgi:hypothetical protein
MTMKVVVELSPAGFVAKVRGQFQWQRETDKTGTGPEIKVPELTLYTPPTNQNAILSLIVDAVKDQANQLFAGKVKHAADYYITLDAKQGAKQPQLFFSSTGAPEAPIVSEMPAIFEADEDLTSEKSIFKLNQTGNTCKLTLDTTRKDQQVIRDDYDGFLTQVAEKGPINAGAANVLKRRIAERLLLDYDNLLYFYYGWDVEKGYIDLQAGMRLRVDYQNYQFVSPSDQTASNGFVGSGSSYYQLNSYLYPTNSDANQYKLGFDSFLSGIQSLETTNVTQDGAGGIVDLLDPACRQPYYRLFYPARFSGAAGRNGAERAVSLIGADSLKAMQAATKEYLKENGKLQGSDNKWVSLYFRGRATVIPEITVFVREQPLYVPVGTTVRQLMERYSNIPAALPGQDLVHLQGAFRPRRLIHEGVNSTPSYRFINYNQVQAISSGLDEFDLPVVKGDRFYL